MPTRDTKAQGVYTWAFIFRGLPIPTRSSQTSPLLEQELDARISPYLGDRQHTYEVNKQSVEHEAALDGLYVVRTSVAEETMSAEDAVRSYKRLANVERAFRSIKTVDLHIRPIHHRLEGRVRAHMLLCMLAYYIQWHMQEALRPMLFADEDQAAKATRDPVAPAKRSAAASKKATSRVLPDGDKVTSFRSLLKNLATITRSTFAPINAKNEKQRFTMLTRASPMQAKAFALLDTIQM